MNKLRVVEPARVAVVTASGDYNPIQNLTKIGFELNKIKFKGSVVFDLLSFNGLSNNRFVQITFNDEGFDRASFCVLNNCDKLIVDEQDLFFKSHPNLLSSSVLSELELSHFK